MSRLLPLALCLFLLTGCGNSFKTVGFTVAGNAQPADDATDIAGPEDPAESESAEEPENLFAAMAGDYRFSIGVGAWRTEELLVYLPGADTADLPAEFLRWAGPRWGSTEDGALGRYGIYNAAEETGFVGAEQTD